MIVTIHDNLLISDLQEKFSNCFPWLRIEFYHRPQSVKKSPEEQFRVDSGKTIGEVRHGHYEGELVIKSWYTLGKVVKDFKEKFGLNVRFFQKENSKWMPAGNTGTFIMDVQRGVTHADVVSIPLKSGEQLDEDFDL